LREDLRGGRPEDRQAFVEFGVADDERNEYPNNVALSRQ
jgi:hypothetical protein